MFPKNAMLQAIMSAEALSLAGASFTWTRVMQEPCNMSGRVYKPCATSVVAEMTTWGWQSNI